MTIVMGPHIDKFSHFIVSMIHKDYAITKQTEHQQFLNLYNIVHAMVSYVVGYQQQANVSRGVTPDALVTTSQHPMIVNFKRFDDVGVFLLVLFGDYLHDYGSVSKNSVQDLKRILKSRDNLDFFLRWVGAVKWIETKFKTKLIEYLRSSDIGLEINSILGASGFNNKKINESVFLVKVVELLQGLRVEQTSTYIMKSMPTKEVLNLVGGPEHPISFDQSSHGSIAKVMGSLKKDGEKNGCRSNTTIDVSIPLIADKGFTQTDNVVRSFFIKFKKYLNTFLSNPDELQILFDKLLSGSFTNDLMPDIVDTNVLHVITKFTVQYKFEGVVWMEYYYDVFGTSKVNELNKLSIAKYNNIKIKVALKTDWMHGSTKPFTVDEIKSAAEIAERSLTTLKTSIFKTLGDLNILMKAIQTESIAVTGDRVAGLMYVFMFEVKYDDGRVDITIDNKSPNIRFIFERTPETVLVCVSQPNENKFDLYKEFLKTKQAISKNINTSKYNRRPSIGSKSMSPYAGLRDKYKTITEASEGGQFVKTLEQLQQLNNNRQREAIKLINSFKFKHISTNRQDKRLVKYFIEQALQENENINKEISNIQTLVNTQLRKLNNNNLVINEYGKLQKHLEEGGSHFSSFINKNDFMEIGAYIEILKISDKLRQELNLARKMKQLAQELGSPYVPPSPEHVMRERPQSARRGVGRLTGAAAVKKAWSPTSSAPYNKSTQSSSGAHLEKTDDNHLKKMYNALKITTESGEQSGTPNKGKKRQGGSLYSKRPSSARK